MSFYYQQDRQPRYYSSYLINQLSRDRYGTDVPTLQRDVERLERKLRERSQGTLHREKQLHELHRRCERLRDNYDDLISKYRRVVSLWREDREEMEEQRRRRRRFY